VSWFLEQISIEGIRGINNAGAPLELKFDPDKVNSVFAPNGAGKSSIFEAVTYALTGAIPKLDCLPAAERGSTYYLNRFHPAGLGRVSLTLRPAGGGASVTATVTRDRNGARTVTTSDGRNGDTLLAELNREFVLLDAKTFQTFIDEAPRDRGRSFARLLGLGSYSDLRQALQALSNTRAFNNHFEVNGKNGRKELIKGQIMQARNNSRASYLALVGEEPAATATNDTLRARAHSILHNIPLIQQKCHDKTFDDISPDDCLACVRDAEGGPDRERLGKLLQAETTWNDAIGALPSVELMAELIRLARERDAALEETKGDLFLRLYRLTEQITAGDDWHDKNVCPACDRRGDMSVLEHARAKVALYDAVTSASERLAKSSSTVDWDKLAAAELATKRDGETSLVKGVMTKVTDGTFTEAAAVELNTRVAAVRERAIDALAVTVAEKEELEKRLPPSLVVLTEKIEAARRLQSALKSEEASSAAHSAIVADLVRVERLRDFLANASAAFSVAETNASTRRLAAVEPLCRDYFDNIMFEPVVPAISKRAGAEDLRISLARFHDLQDVSAQSLLSESYRNAFAISVYLAAAALYGGSPKFLLLDDITSSLDAGHQFHLMEVIRTRFSRPGNANGPQVIILSHDTLLEKYFNTNGSTAGWWHQRIEGTPRTAILPQSNAVNRVRDATIALLNAGNAQDAAPRIRQYLEYVLEEVIIRCRVPVPMDIALSDDKRMAGHLIGAIDAQVRLHAGANSLILEPAQVQGLNAAVATITANFLAHWSTGQTQAFAPGALVGVMQAIDNYADCFKFDPSAGAGRRYYRSLSQRQ
jgi:energy-coupling factor transporter ATP-binding protein EcfA2